MATDPISLNLFWIGDRPSESFLPRSADPQIRDRWESLTRSLDTCLNRNAVAGDILISAFRDTAALAVALRTAFILTYQPLQNNSTDRSPGICAALASWGIPCQQINPLDAIATIERDNLRRLIVQAGLSKLLWAGLHLVVLHLVMPSTFGLCDRIAPAPDNGSPDMHDHAEQAILTTNPWQEAQGFWYQI
ncbi:MAG: hypothetical protein N2235_16000 [Fischerella sp.]|nr:hypothetical protein [Fischerella sp.]